MLTFVGQSLISLALQPSPGQSEFVPVAPGTATENLAAGPLLVAAYAFVWIATMVYLWTIWRRLNKVEADMRSLEARQAQRH